MAWPADKRPAAVSDVSGRVWNGAATLRGGQALRWRFSLVRSLAHGGFAADWTLDGTETALTGRAVTRPGRLVATDVQGRAGWALVRVFAPGLGMECDLAARVDVSRLAVGGRRTEAEGELSSGPATCRTASGEVSELPPLTALAGRAGDGSEVTLFPTSNPDETLARAQLPAQGMAVFTLTREGAALIPGMEASGRVTLEMEL